MGMRRVDREATLTRDHLQVTGRTEGGRVASTAAVLVHPSMGICVSKHRHGMKHQRTTSPRPRFYDGFEGVRRLESRVLDATTPTLRLTLMTLLDICSDVRGDDCCSRQLAPSGQKRGPRLLGECCYYWCANLLFVCFRDWLERFASAVSSPILQEERVVHQITIHTSPPVREIAALFKLLVQVRQSPRHQDGTCA